MRLTQLGKLEKKRDDEYFVRYVRDGGGHEYLTYWGMKFYVLGKIFFNGGNEVEIYGQGLFLVLYSRFFFQSFIIE